MILLRKLNTEDVYPFFNWVNDKEVIRFSLSLFQKINTKKEIKNWFNELLHNQNDLNLGIVLKSSGKLIGYAGLCNISATHKSAEYFIFIGEKEFWGKGIGRQVTEKILEIGFNQYQLNRIMLTVSEPNIGGRIAYEKAGFKLEGRLRQATFRENGFHDKLVMSVLRSEWKEN